VLRRAVPADAHEVRKHNLAQMGTTTLVAVSAAAQHVKRQMSTTTLVDAAEHVKRRAKIHSRRLGSMASKTEPSEMLSKASENMVEKLDDELSAESMLIEDTMEALLDTIDKAAAHTTTLLHHSSQVQSAAHSATTTLSQHAHQLHSASSFLSSHKTPIIEGLSTAVHAASMYPAGGIASAGFAVGLACAVLPMMHSAMDSADV